MLKLQLSKVIPSLILFSLISGANSTLLAQTKKKSASKSKQNISQNKVVAAQGDKLVAGRPITMTGFVGEKLHNAAVNRVFAQDVNRLVEPFRHRDEARCWQTEFWGKWFTSAVLAYKYQPTPEAKAVLDKAVNDLISTQTPDGYIGNYKPENLLQQWDIWGRKYCLLGLLDYYDITGDKKTLAAASKLADNLLSDLAAKDDTIVTKGNHRGMAASSVLEPLCLLYTRTGNNNYLAAAKKIVAQWETPVGPQLISKAGEDVAKRFPTPTPSRWFGPDQGQKAYEMMSCYEGLLELFRITGDAAYKTAVETTWQNIMDTEINAAGSGSAIECWFGGKALQTNPIFKYQETCVTVTWIKLSQQLLRLTGEAKYADAIETAYYNALLGAMSPDGKHWAQYTPLSGRRMEGEEHCSMGLNCCIASGPRGLFTIPHTSVMSFATGLSVNFYMPGSYETTTPSQQQARLAVETEYPRNGAIKIIVDVEKPEAFDIRMRIPEWSKSATININGETRDNLTPGSFATINRTWKKGDVISINLDLNPRIQKMGANPTYVALMRGPILFARDTRLGGPELTAVLKPVTSKDGGFAIRDTTAAQKDVWMQVSAMFIPESYPDGREKPVALSFCDYASAGNGATPSYFLVWMPQLVDARDKPQYAAVPQKKP